jgi:predicted dehydrogenase
VIRFGGVGLGRGLGLLELLAGHPDVEVVAVCDERIESDPSGPNAIERLRRAGAKIQATYNDFDRFVQHDMDAVLIATPPAKHAAMSITALDAGLHTICEVPAIYNDLAEADALLRAARRSRAKYMLAENCCYWGFIQTWSKLVAEGRIGRATYAEGEYVHDVPELMTRPDGSLTWRASLYPLQYLTHELGPLLEIMADRVTSVVAMDTGPQRQPDWSTPDQAVGVFRTAGGRVIKILCSFSNARRPPHHYFSIYGTKGCLETSRAGLKILANFDDEPEAAGPIEMPIEYGPDSASGLSEGHGGADAAMLYDFVDCAVQDKPPTVDAVRGLEFSVPGLCARESAMQGGQPVDVPDYRGA